MPKYQVQYKNNSKTFNDVFEANSYIEILDFFETVVNAEVTEIREFVYQSSFYPKDIVQNTKTVSCTVFRGSFMRTFKIPKLKESLKELELINLIKMYIKINNLPPENIKIKYSF